MEVRRTDDRRLHELASILQVATSELAVERGTVYFVDDTKGEIWSKIAEGLDGREIRLPVGKQDSADATVEWTFAVTTPPRSSGERERLDCGPRRRWHRSGSRRSFAASTLSRMSPAAQPPAPLCSRIVLCS
jgi:hypothetical protein